jgi:hypothetical protein
MKLDSHRHFLRLRIIGDTVTVFPIKIDKVPDRNQWKDNRKRETDKSTSVFRPEPAMRAKLIEDPIEIIAEHARSTTQVKTPSALSPRR